jgi:hypothetical protein
MSRFSQQRRPRRHPLAPHRFLPGLEALEDRRVPTITFQPRFGNPTPGPSDNGPVLTNAPIYLIFEGSYWNNPTGITKQDVLSTVTNILGSPYLSRSSQYGTSGAAHLAGTAVDNSLRMTTLLPADVQVFAESDLRNVVQANIHTGLNAAALRPLYFLLTPPGASDQDRSSAGGFHNEVSYNVSFFGFKIPEEVPFGWIGTFGATRASQVDIFSANFSHELVEAVTDPYIATDDANRYDSGANWNPPRQKDEIADFEPDGGRYTYRLGNGAVVQAYWSANDGQFVVADGTSQVFSLVPRYDLFPHTLLPDPTKFRNFDLTVNGGQLANKNDTIRIETITSGPQTGGVRIVLNGETVTFDAGRLQNITVNTGTGNDTVDVESLPANVALTIKLGSGNDTVRLSPTAGQMDNILGAISIQGGTGTSTVDVNDRGTTDLVGILRTQHTVTYVVQGSQFTRDDFVVRHLDLLPTTTQTFHSAVSFSGISRLVISGGNCANDYDIQTDALTTPVTVHGGSATDALAFDDSALSSAFSATYTLTSDQVKRVGISPSGSIVRPTLVRTATVDFYGIANVNVDGAGTASTFNVLGVAGATQVGLFPGRGANIITVGDANNTLGEILGGLSIWGQGNDTLLLNDRAMVKVPGFTDVVSFAITDRSVVRTDRSTYVDPFGPLTSTSTQTINYSGVKTLIVQGGAVGNTFTVKSIKAGSTVKIERGTPRDLVTVLTSAASGGHLFIDGRKQF